MPCLLFEVERELRFGQRTLCRYLRVCVRDQLTLALESQVVQVETPVPSPAAPSVQGSAIVVESGCDEVISGQLLMGLRALAGGLVPNAGAASREGSSGASESRCDAAVVACWSMETWAGAEHGNRRRIFCDSLGGCGDMSAGGNIGGWSLRFPEYR